MGLFGLLWEVYADEHCGLSLRDKVLVPLVSQSVQAFSGHSLEMGMSLLFTSCGLALFMLDVFKVVGSKGVCRLVSFALGLSFFLMGYYMNNNLPIEYVPQSSALYGSQPLDETPNLPSIDGPLVANGEYFVDQEGRTLMLRGINLGGDSKVPTFPDGSTWQKMQFFDTEKVSFVGRPFPLEEADEHLGRLRSWGFTFVRFLVTWEAIEHEGPGIYDQEYIDYVVQVVRKCKEYGISVFIDPHQDVWSRWTGGDGAPAWTLTKAGFNIENMDACGAAVTHQMHQGDLPQMLWATNYARLGAGTMFTLFFSGNTYAPNTKIDGQSAQDFLQNHYINAIAELAKNLKDESNVLGYDTLNEPSNGFAGLTDLKKPLFPAPLGWFNTGFQTMILGAGRSLKVPFFPKPMVLKSFDVLNQGNVSCWTDAALDIWQNEGVWKFDDNDKPVLLRPDHFALNKNGKPVKFVDDFMVPFFRAFDKAIKAAHPGTMTFVEPFIDPASPKHGPAPTEMESASMAWAPHYYDAAALMLKTTRPWLAFDIDREIPVFSQSFASQAISSNLASVKDTGRTLGKNGAPVLIGEIGIPMDLEQDMSGKAAAYKNNDFSMQILAMDRTMQGLEDNLLSFTLWTYAASNTNRNGDNWNQEDLSLFSREQQEEPAEENVHSGGRALQAAVRPYPMKTMGTPLSMKFRPLEYQRPFHYEFTTTPDQDATTAPTIIFVPSYQYPKGVVVDISDGSFNYDKENQIVEFFHDKKKTSHTITITHNKK